MLKLILALVLSVIAMLIIGPRVLPVLRKLKFGQSVYELGPKSHQVKQGTPTMGGLMFAFVACAASLLLHGTWYGFNDFILALIYVSGTTTSRWSRSATWASSGGRRSSVRCLWRSASPCTATSIPWSAPA